MQVLDIDRDEDDAPFIVLERLFGETLADRMRRRPPLDVGASIAIARQILAGVAAMHRAGVVHRDLKPSNVFLGEGGVAPFVKLVDFGVSKIHEELPAEITRLGETVGTFSFMPPEQIQRSADVGPAADLWAVGVLLYRMLTGANPFTAGDPVSLIASILEGAPAALGPEAAPLQRVIDRALMKDPAMRHPSADALAADLDEAARALGVAGEAAPASRPASVASPASPFDGPTAITDDAPTQLSLAAVGTMGPEQVAPPGAFGWRGLAATIVAAVVLGGATGWLSGAPSPAPAAANAAFVSIRVEPAEATITIAGSPVADPSRVDATAGTPQEARISAPGYRTRVLSIPDRPGATVVVRLERQQASSPDATSAPERDEAPPSVGALPIAPRRITGPTRQPTSPPSATGGSARPPVIHTAPY